MHDLLKALQAMRACDFSVRMTGVHIGIEGKMDYAFKVIVAANQRMAQVLERIPTPSSNDWKGSSKEGQRRGQLTDPAMGVIPAGGSLNPTWVEWLMGFPLGWTALEPSETPSSRKSSKRSVGASSKRK